MRWALHAEWTKLRTVPGPAWLLVAIAVFTVAPGAAVAAAVECPGAACSLDPATVSFAGVQLSQAIVAILAVVIISGEHGTGMIRTTLSAVPRRGHVLAAKAAVLSAGVLGAATVGVVGSLVAGRLILPGRGFAATGQPVLSLADGSTSRAAIGSALYLVLIGLLALGLGAAVRDAAAAIGVVLGLLYLAPILVPLITDPIWQLRLKQYTPMPAGLTVQATIGVDSLPIDPWRGLGVLALWAAAALLAGGLALRFRDA